MSKETAWGRMAFHILHSGNAETRIAVCGRERWALECLVAAGDKGCTPIETPGPRWSGYVHKLRRMGFAIETIRESHGGPFEGTHARYVLRSRVRRAEGGAA